MRLLILGAGGQVGQDLLRLAAARGIAAVGLRHAELDIADADAVRAAVAAANPTLIVNAAAYTRVDQAEREPDAAFRVNATGPAVLADAAAERDLPLVHFSTDYVFDGRKTSPYVEDDPPAPLGIYGASKLAGEAGVRRWRKHIVLRTSWVYGVFGANFVKTMLRLCRERDELRVVADQRGCPTGSADLAEAVLAIAPTLHSDRALWGLYHFAGTGETSWHGFAEAIAVAQARHTSRQPEVVAITTADFPTAAVRPTNSALDSARFASAFGHRAIAWQERLGQVVEELAAGGQIPDAGATAPLTGP